MKFEDAITVIDLELAKRRVKWTLHALAWLDFEDVSQIIRLHIFKKWKQYNPAKPLAPWVSRIISNQIKNLIRNLYGNFSRPCLRCAAAEEPDGCGIYGSQCSSCPLYAYWEKNKKSAHDTRLPLPLVNHELEVFEIADESFDLDKATKELHQKMLANLRPLEKKIYRLLYIEGKDDEAVAKACGWFCNEKNRNAGYKSISNIKKIIIERAKKILEKGEINFYN